MVFWRVDEPGLTRLVTDRSGGHSTGPYAGLNLARHVGDDEVTVESNRAEFAATLGVPRERLVFMNQRHGATVHIVDGPWPGRDVPPGDAVVTTAAGLALVVLVADCVPVLLADRSAGVVAAVHAGRPGLAAGVVPATVAAMRDLGAITIGALVGPSVCGRCYEVPAAMRDDVAAAAPIAATVSWTGTPALDVAGGVVAQLVAAGVRVDWLPGCTREDERLYSYRRSPVTGRFAAAVVRHSMAPAAGDRDETRAAYR